MSKGKKKRDDREMKIILATAVLGLAGSMIELIKAIIDWLLKP